MATRNNTAFNRLDDEKTLQRRLNKKYTGDHNAQWYLKKRSKLLRQLEQSAKFAVFDGPVPAQRAPLYDVRIMGVCVEWTSSRGDAHAAYLNSPSRPKELWRVDAGGQRTLLLCLRSEVVPR